MSDADNLPQQPSLPFQRTHLAESSTVPANAKVSPESVFKGPVWYMEALVKLPGLKAGAKCWDFRTVPGFPGGFALALAEYGYSRIYKSVETHDREVEWLTVRNDLVMLNDFAQFCSNQGRTGFSEVDDSLCERYLQTLFFSHDKRETKSKDRIKNIVRCIYKLWEFGVALTEPIPSIPFGRPFEKLFNPSAGGTGNYENKTPVIPEPVYGPMMNAAVNYILEYSPTIIETWRELQSCWTIEVAPLALSQEKKLKKLNKAAKKIIAGKKSSWRKSAWIGLKDIYNELQQLRKACIIVILAYSGIRSSELLSLEAGCCITDEGQDGHVMHYINTVLHKYRGNGARDTWVVIDEVVKSITILEILTARVRTATNDNRLIISDGTNAFFNVQKDFTGAEITELTNEAVTYQIDSFREYCNINLNGQPIPDWADKKGELKPWHFNMRQFRRTLARYIARQPYGVIAGMIQYKHVEVAMFEGYAGVEPDWNKMLEEEKVLASVDILEELAIDLSQGAIAGEFGIRLQNEFMTEFRGRAEDFPASQIAKWLANEKKALFVGKFNFCFFDPTKALCTIEIKQKDKPVLNFCQPGNCSNACITKRHAPIWNALLKQANEFAEHPKTSEFQRNALREEVNQLRAVVVNFRSK